MRDVSECFPQVSTSWINNFYYSNNVYSQNRRFWFWSHYDRRLVVNEPKQRRFFPIIEASWILQSQKERSTFRLYEKQRILWSFGSLGHHHIQVTPVARRLNDLSASLILVVVVVDSFTMTATRATTASRTTPTYNTSSVRVTATDDYTNDWV